MNPIVLQGTGLRVQRGRRLVVDDFSLALHAGEVVGIYGPNGAGKSTLLQALAGLLKPAAGELVFHGRSVGGDLPLLEFHRRTAAVFQEPLLLQGTVWQNVTLGLKLRGIPAAEHARRATPWLERLGIAHLREQRASSLSGGEAQRASLARALVLDPEVLFLDEPFASLDAPTRLHLVGELGDILAERKIAALLVTHDLGEAAEICDRCVVQDQGRLLQEGDLAAIASRPCSRRVAEITGAANIFESVVVAVSSAEARLDWKGVPVLASACPHPVGTRATFVLRQESIEVSSRSEALPNRLEATVERVRARGDRVLVTARLPSGEKVTASRPALPVLAPGATVTLSFPSSAVWILPESPARPSR